MKGMDIAVELACNTTRSSPAFLVVSVRSDRSMRTIPCHPDCYRHMAALVCLQPAANESAWEAARLHIPTSRQFDGATNWYDSPALLRAMSKCSVFSQIWPCDKFATGFHRLRDSFRRFTCRQDARMEHDQPYRMCLCCIATAGFHGDIR